LIFGILIFIFLAISSEFFQRKKINRKFFPIFLIVFLILFLLILKSFFPLLFGGIVQNFRAISIGISPQPLARELVSEMIPLGFQGAFARFSTLFYLSLISLFIILYDFIKERKPECLLIFVWTLIIILMAGIIPLIGQQRFAYYLSFNISILSGFLIVKGFKFGWQGLKKTQAISQGSSIQPYLLVGSILIIFNSIFFLFFPFPLNIFNSYPNNLPDILRLSLVAAREGTFIRESDWYDSLNWLKENTPDPGVDYYALYKEPGIDKVRGEINPYPYPETAYGVLARWDVGHMITYYAHRIPNSNPFHQGVGKKKDGEIVELGETVFFLENKEEKAIEYLDELKTRYVITDYLSANPELTFKSMVKWFEGSLEDYYLQEGEEIGERASKFDNSMIVRLHILDGREKILKREVKGEEKEFYIEPLAHFRLVYESEKTVGFSKEDPNDVTKAIKIFEYIKGAKIKGKAPDNMTVVVSTKIKTNQEREFTYQKTIVAKNGYFEFVLPYSTYGEKGRLPGQTQFSVFASPYQLKIGDKKIEVNITEEDILEGKEIEIVN